MSFGVVLAHVAGEAARRYRERALQENPERADFLNHVGRQILEGKATIEEFDTEAPMWDLFWIEDFVVQVGQGSIAPRPAERLGRMDAGVILLRKLFQRELKALAEDRPLKRWTTPPGLADETSIGG